MKFLYLILTTLLLTTGLMANTIISQVNGNWNSAAGKQNNQLNTITDKSNNDAVAYYRIHQADMISIGFNGDVRDNVSIQLINRSEQEIVRKVFSKASYRLVVIAMGAGSGVYAIRISDSNALSEVKTIML